jgi:hypothetical protein
MGYLPRVLFFNAFQLGTESKNQVFSSEEASIPSIFQTFSPLLLKRTNINFSNTHFSKTKTDQQK